MQASSASQPTWWVACLCAEWCGVCREWRPAFEAVARDHPGLRFAWVDVEDEADAMGEVDIETFPTLLVACGAEPLFLGPILPSTAQLARLIAGLREQGTAGMAVPTTAAALIQRLLPRVLPSCAL